MAPWFQNRFKPNLLILILVSSALSFGPTVTLATTCQQALQARPLESFRGRLIERVVTPRPTREFPSRREYKIVRLAEVFGPNWENTTLIGFGRPNVWLATPNAVGDHSRFDAQSLYRGEAKFNPSQGIAQTGVMIRLQTDQLPPEAREQLVNALQAAEGKKTITCVNAVCQVLDGAGITSGGERLHQEIFPMHFFERILRDGLEWGNHQLQFDVVNTTGRTLDQFAQEVTKAQQTTLLRHGQRLSQALTQSSRAFWTQFASRIPVRFSLFSNFQLSQGNSHRRDALTHPPDQNTVTVQIESGPRDSRDLQLEIPKDLILEESTNTPSLVFESQPTGLGFVLGNLWGHHQLTEIRWAEPTSLALRESLPNNLLEFSKKSPTLVNQLKQHVLFSEPVVSVILSQIAPTHRLSNLENSSRLFEEWPIHSENMNNKFNYVVTKDRWIFTKLKVRHAFVDWLLTKHVLVSGYDANVKIAGEIWKDSEGRFHLNIESGTYQPSNSELIAFGEFLKTQFPDQIFVLHFLTESGIP